MSNQQNSIQTITPYLTIKDAEAAIAFYTHVFDAQEIGRITMGGYIGHAELQFGNSKLMLAEEMPTWGNLSPTTLAGTPVTIALQVSDVDSTFQRALDAGATMLEAVKDQFYGERAGVFADPFGHRWHVSTNVKEVSFAEMQKHCDTIGESCA